MRPRIQSNNFGLYWLEREFQHERVDTEFMVVLQRNSFLRVENRTSEKCGTRSLVMDRRRNKLDCFSDNERKFGVVL